MKGQILIELLISTAMLLAFLFFSTQFFAAEVETSYRHLMTQGERK